MLPARSCLPELDRAAAVRPARIRGSRRTRHLGETAPKPNVGARSGQSKIAAARRRRPKKARPSPDLAAIRVPECVGTVDAELGAGLPVEDRLLGHVAQVL